VEESRALGRCMKFPLSLIKLGWLRAGFLRVAVGKLCF